MKVGHNSQEAQLEFELEWQEEKFTEKCNR